MPSHDHLTNGLLDLDAKGGRDRLLEAKTIAKAMLATPLQEPVRKALEAGLAAVDAELVEASRCATIAISALLDTAVVMQSRRPPTPKPALPPKPLPATPRPPMRTLPTPAPHRPPSRPPVPAAPAERVLTPLAPGVPAALHNRERRNEHGWLVPPLDPNDADIAF